MRLIRATTQGAIQLGFDAPEAKNVQSFFNWKRQGFKGFDPVEPLEIDKESE